MEVPKDAEAIAVKVREELEGTTYACSSLRPLIGGTANFMYHGTLLQHLPDGTKEILIKHGEEYLALSPSFALSTSRCLLEEKCVKAVAALPTLTTPVCAVRAPKLLQFDQKTNTQIQEYLPDAVNLKMYALQFYDTPDSETVKSHAFGIGSGLGKWLRAFHSWAQQSEQAAFRKEMGTNTMMQTIKNHYNYGNLTLRIDRFPELLEDARDIFVKVQLMSQSELSDESKLQLIHGDFWTGNALLPRRDISNANPIDVFIVDWEMCQLAVLPLDLGQMMAEMYELYLFKGIRAGLWLIEGFTNGYGDVDDDFAFRVAIHLGAHLVSIGSVVAGWGSEEQIRNVVSVGKELIVRGWKKDIDWFRASDLACLFQRH